MVTVGSRNPVKMAAVREALDGREVVGVDVASGVSAQPVGDEETIRGAVNRARAALAVGPAEAEWGVGLEGGVAEIGGSLYCFAWCAMVDRAGQLGLACTGRCELPPRVAALILRDGMELGAANDLVFGRVNSKHGEGAVGILTGGRIDRAAFYAPAVTMAMVRFLTAAAVFAPVAPE